MEKQNAKKGLGILCSIRLSYGGTEQDNFEAYQRTQLSGKPVLFYETQENSVNKKPFFGSGVIPPISHKYAKNP